jgi:hypothetical protein
LASPSVFVAAECFHILNTGHSSLERKGVKHALDLCPPNHYFGSRRPFSLSSRVIVLTNVTNSLFLSGGCGTILMRSLTEMPSGGMAFLISCSEGNEIGRGAPPADVGAGDPAREEG